MLTGVAAIGALIFTALSLQTTRDQVRITEQGQFTERFTNAITQLGAQNSLEIRLGGIFALERIARDSERDHATVMEVLTAFIREHAPVSPCNEDRSPDADIQAAVTVIGRRDATHDVDPIDLHNTCLPQVSLFYANLAGAIFDGATLSRADLRGTDLSSASLTNARLVKATNGLFRMSEVRHSEIRQANFSLATMTGTDLTDAEFGNACFAQTDLERATIVRTELHGAGLNEANLPEANLESA
ncbi:pentapeptide repeat-containing protein [Amycolatopsis sp. NPDC004378]